ncbi:MAG: periplasmic heavy metal sensor [Bacteroidales bacterium]|nr:periplasmic heavy metal sensor [Bacteroidales bacterium]
MNFFLRNRAVIWVLAGLLIITMSVLASMVYHTWTEPEEVVSQPGCSSSCQMLSNELELTGDQQEQMDTILNHFRDSSSALVSELRQSRLALMEELQSDLPDTLRILQLSEEIGAVQSRMTRLAASQYLHIRSICDPEQQQALSNVYCDLFGCPRVNRGQGEECKDNSRQRHRNGRMTRE